MDQQPFHAEVIKFHHTTDGGISIVTKYQMTSTRAGCIPPNL